MPGYRVRRRLTPRGLEQRRRRRLFFKNTTIVALFLVLSIGFSKLFATAHQIITTGFDDTNNPRATYVRPTLSPLPEAQEVWNCEVVVLGGSLGGVAAASHAMQAGATTCLIELTPWLGGQISSQGVSAIDESYQMIKGDHKAASWKAFRQRILQQPVTLPDWVGLGPGQKVSDINNCWVGKLCFPPKAGATASEEMLQAAVSQAPDSRWGTQIAFKGAEFNDKGNEITAIYAVRREPRSSDYVPQGRFSEEIASWYSWSDDDQFTKVPLRLEPVPGRRFLVIDATDTGELIGWAKIPYSLGAESKVRTGEVHAPPVDTPACTQAFTYPFVLGLHDKPGEGIADLALLQPQYSHEEHRNDYSLLGFPMYEGKRSFFNYRRIVSTQRNDPFRTPPSYGDMAMINWNRGNDWPFMNPSLILTGEELADTGQYENWMGGLSPAALKNGENHAFLFALWLLENYTKPKFPLVYLSGPKTPMGTESGLSMVPYFREGRRILGRKAYGQSPFMMLEQDIRADMEGRDFGETAIAVTHYAIDIHGCRHRNWEPAQDANSAPAGPEKVRPTQIPLESLVPQQVNNLLIGGKSIAVSHIVNGMTRIHNGEYGVGSAAGAIAGWLLLPEQQDLQPADIVRQGRMPELHRFLLDQGLRFEW